MILAQSRQKAIGWVAAAVLIAIGIGVWLGPRLLASYYLNQGITQLRVGAYSEANRLLGQALRFQPKNPMVHFYLAEVALGRTDPDGPVFYPDADYAEAIARYENALSFGLESDQRLYAEALNDLGFSYWVRMEFDKANAKFLERINITPDRSFLSRYFVASDYINRLNKPPEALEILLPAPDSAFMTPIERKNVFRSYARLATLYYYFNDFNNAEKYAKLTVQAGGQGNTHRDVQIAYAILAYVYGQQGNFTAAESAIEQANELASSPDAYTCRLAKSYFLGKDYPKAINVAKRAKTPKGSYAYPGCLIVLGESFLALGSTAEAKKYLIEFVDTTNAFSPKDIFVLRGRLRAIEALEELGVRSP